MLTILLPLACQIKGSINVCFTNITTIVIIANQIVIIIVII